MLSTTTEDESDDCYKPRKKQHRQRVLQSSSSDSDESVIARPRRKKCRVPTSSSDSDDSILTRPSRKKCKVLSQTESSSASSSSASDSENEESLCRWSDKRPKKRTVPTDSEASSCEETSPAKRPSSTAVQADANSSDSDEGERCIICFKTLRPPFAHPSNCSHNFHPVCLSTWSKTSNTCPIDRVKYTAVITVDCKGDLVSREQVSTPPPQDHNADFEPDDATFCEVCSQHDREHEMLLCDRCEAGYHLDCLSPPLREVPEGNWYCPRCEDLGLELHEEVNELMSDAAVILESRMRRRQPTSVRIPRGPRTRGAQRVFNIIHRQAGQPSTSSEVTISRQRSSSSRRRRNSGRRPQSTRYKVELITVEDGTTLEVKVAVNTRTRTKSKKHSKRRSKKKCSKSSRRSVESSRSYDNSFAGEGPSQSLDLFGSRPTLEYFSGCEAEDELDEDRGGDMAILRRAARTGPRNMASRKQMAAQILNSNQRRVAPRIEVSSAPVDLVSSIMEQQEKWHSPHASYESTSNGNIRVILKDKAGRSRHAGGTSSGAGGSGTTSGSVKPSGSSSRPDRPSTSRTESGSSSTTSSSKPRGDGDGSARSPSPHSDFPLGPESPVQNQPEGDDEQSRDNSEERISPPSSPTQCGDGSGRKETSKPEKTSSPNEAESPRQTPPDSRMEQPASPDGLPESSNESLLDSGPAHVENQNADMGVKKAYKVGESRDKTAESPEPPGSDRKEQLENEPVDALEEVMDCEPPASPDTAEEGASTAQRIQSPDRGASNDVRSPASPDLGSVPCKQISDDSSRNHDSTLNPQPVGVGNQDIDDLEAHSPFPCLDSLQEPMSEAPVLSAQAFQAREKSQEEGRLSDESRCGGNRRDTPGQTTSTRPALTSRKMSNCSDLSDDDSDQYGSNRGSKMRSPAQEDSDGEPKRHGQPCSPDPSYREHSHSYTRQNFNGLESTSPHEDISSDSINMNSSAERLVEPNMNRSEEEKDGLVEITDEEISNYERKWEMEKKLVENTELEGLEAISDVESPGQKSAKSDGGGSGLERLEDGLETISDLEPEGPKPEKEEKDEDTPKHKPSMPDVTPEDTQIEEEGEIRDDEAPITWKKVSKERSYRGMKDSGKEISKEIIPKERDRKTVDIDRQGSRISSSDKGRKNRGGSSSSSSSSSTSSSSRSRGRSNRERSVSRMKRKRSRSRTRSRDRNRTRSRDRPRDRTRSRGRDRDRIRSRDRARDRTLDRVRDRSVDRDKDRSRSRVSRDRYRRDRSRDRRSRSRDRKRRRTRSPRKDKSRSRDRSRRSRDRQRSRRTPSESSSSDSSSCSCSSCEREEMRRQKRKDRRDSKERDRSRDRDKSKRDRSPRSKKRRTPGPSKEVFTSGDNILVSVNFKKDGEGKVKEPIPVERKKEKKKEEKDRPKKDKKESKENKPVKRKDKKTSEESPKKQKKKKKIDTSNMKTVAIIDLDTSPFKVTTPTNELIVLTDSDVEDKANEDPRMGPRTPPEPQMKFTLAAKKQQLRNLANPLISLEREGAREDDLSHGHRGPNTPPEPEIRSPYDPFEPTKSPTPEDGRGRQSAHQEPNQQVPQVSLTPPRARPQHVAPVTPSPLHSPPSTLEQQDRPKLMPFQPLPVDSGDDSPGGGGGGGGDSPYSPGSSEGDDLFEPPQQLPPAKPKPRVPLPLPLREHPSKHAIPPPKTRPNTASKDAPQKVSGKKEGGMKIDENQQKLLDDLPNSAVEMQFIEKLHRQERVVEEVKLILKPHYAKKHINKDEYKEILRRSVPKICHSRTGEINPMKIQKLIDAYVQRFRHKRKLAAGGGNPVANPIPPLRQNKPVVIK